MTASLYRQEPCLSLLVQLCKSNLSAEEVWLFGSRARGDHRPDSDWDILAILPDTSPESFLEPVLLWELRRKSGLKADLFAVKRSEFQDALDSVTTLSRAVHDEGVRLDV
ncbi:MAG: nucleotidyltransferase domain-containing protein [Fuscovulum sp.]|nr:MAG: nucleotidyltransferase domain-containing protein [Fuscovulum sp.]